MDQPKTNSPFAPSDSSARGPQISLRTLLLIMVVFSVCSATLFYGTNIPTVAIDLTSSLGLPTPNIDPDLKRRSHLRFLLFCYSAPLLMASGVSLLSVGLRRWESYRNRPLPDSLDEND